MLFSLAYLQAKIIPSIPLEPNPPGTKTASAPFNIFLMFLDVMFSASTKLIFTFALFLMPACSNASLIDLYESFNSVYLPTNETFTSLSGRSLALTTFFQSLRLGFFVLIFNFLMIVSSTFCLFNKSGTEYTVSTSCIDMTLSIATEQKSAIFFFSSLGNS